MADETVSGALRDLANRTAKDNGFCNYELRIESISSGGGNFLGDLYTIDIVERGKDTLHLFSKVSNMPPHARAAVQISMMYEREVFAYTDLAKAFDKLQEKHSVAEADRFNFAKYYASDLTDMQEMLILENLSRKGYVMYDRKKSFNWEYAKASLEQLARFHALSFALEIEDPESFDALIRNKKEFFSNKPRNTSSSINYQAAILKNALDSSDARYHGALVNLFQGLEYFWMEQMQPLRATNALTHGDYRVSNHMVKYEEGVLTSLVMVDFQTMFYGSPVNDIMYLMFTGSDAEFRRRHYEDCMQHYRGCLGRTLAAMGHDLEEVYPVKLFQEDVKDKLKFGLALAIFMLPMILVEATEAPKISDLVDENKETTAPPVNYLYRERLTGILEDMISWGVLVLDD